MSVEYDFECFIYRTSSNSSVMFKDERLKDGPVGNYIRSLHIFKEKGTIKPAFPSARYQRRSSAFYSSGR